MRNTQRKELDKNILEEIKKKLLFHGTGSLTDSELLCLIINSGDETKSVRDQADFLLRRYGTIRDVCLTEVNQLMERNPGITERKAMFIKAAFELGKRARHDPLTGAHLQGAQSVFDFVKGEYDFADRECFKAILLTAKNNVISVEDISVGTLTASSLHVRELFKCAVMKSAYSLVAVHNHPSGDPTPSPQDDNLTEAIREAGEVMGIIVADHIIVGSQTYYSYAEEEARIKEMLEVRERYMPELSDEEMGEALRRFIGKGVDKDYYVPHFECGAVS